MRLLVTGSRHWGDEESIRSALKYAASAYILEGGPGPDGELQRHTSQITVVHGACPTGADAIADKIAKELGMCIETFPADWESHGKAAGPMRNQTMVDTLDPSIDKCVAFLLPGSRGTIDCIRRARRAGIHVNSIQQGGQT